MLICLSFKSRGAKNAKILFNSQNQNLNNSFIVTVLEMRDKKAILTLREPFNRSVAVPDQMSEEVGFEPTVRGADFCFQDRRIRPLCHSSIR